MPGTQRLDEPAHAQLHEAISASLTAAQLAAWRPAFEGEAARLVASLPAERPIDLVATIAAPWSLAVAQCVTGVPPGTAPECAALARGLFLEAAHSTDGGSNESMQRSAAALSRLLAHGATDRSAVPDVQMFVALSQTLPSLIAAAWLALLREPEQLARMREGATPHSAAIAELLRLAGPARAVFRVALDDAELGTVRVRAGDRVILLLAVANRDPLRYRDPDRLDLERPAAGHLALGAGTHRCAGSTLVQFALSVVTAALIRGTQDVRLADDADARIAWLDGFTMRAPRTLPAIVRREDGARKGYAPVSVSTRRSQL